jgi:hypothetical protein
MVDQELEVLKQVAKGFSRDVRSRRGLRKNPVGGDSFVDLLGEDRSRIVRGLPGYPKAEPAAAADYGYQFPFKMTHKKQVEIGRGPQAGTRRMMPVNGGLVMILGGPVSEREEQGGYGPKLPNGKSWAGVGWKILQDMAAVEPLFTGSDKFIYTFQDLTPYGRSNPMGTGIWSAITSQIYAGKVRKDEGWVAGRMMRAIGEVLEKVASNRYQGGLPAAKQEINNYLDVLFTVIFGTTDAFTLGELDQAGTEAIKSFAAEREQERASGGSTRSQAALTGLAALGRGLK